MHEPRGAAGAGQEGYKLSDEEMEGVSGGSWSDCGSHEWFGDTRENIDPELAHADFVNGTINGGVFF